MKLSKFSPPNRPMPKAPAVYRPQPVPKVLQTKAKPGSKTPVCLANQKPPLAHLHKTPIQPARAPQVPPHKRVPATPPTRPWQKSPPAQLKARTSNAVAQRKIKAPSSNTIQRLVLFTHGPRLRQNNVAESIANMVDYGITKTTLNDRTYPGGSKEEFITALLEPTLSVEQGELARVAVSVQSVPVQRVSYLMELPTRGDWRLRVAASNIRVKLANQPILEGVTIPIGAHEGGSVMMNVHGLPNNPIFSDLVETHEDVHVGDIQTAIEEILKPWDTRLTTFRNQRTRFEGHDQETAKARLYRAAGGTPREIATRFLNTLRQKGMAFHDTDAGKAPSIVAIVRSGPEENSVLDVYLKHRAGLIVMHEQKLEEEEKRIRAEREQYDRGLSRSLARPVTAPINAGSAGNSFINDDML